MANSGKSGRDELLGTLDVVEGVLTKLLRVTLTIAAVVLFVGAICIIWTMDGSSRSQGGRIYVALGAMVALGAVDSQFTKLLLRRAETMTPSQYWRQVALHLLLFVGAGITLFGLALLAP